MDIQTLRDLLPDYAYDMRDNLAQVLSENGAPGLSEKQIALTAMASAMSTPSTKLIEGIENFAQATLSDKEIKGAKTAHAIMSMTNVYYRFLHVVDNREYKRMPPGLQMKAEAKPGISKKDFHLGALAVSAINNCKTCIDFHELHARRMGMAPKGIQSTVRIAAVINAVGELLKFR